MVPKISFGPPIVAAARKEFPDTIFDVNHAPSFFQLISIGATKTRRSSVVHIRDRKASTRPILNPRIKGGARGRRRPPVTLHQQGRPLSRARRLAPGLRLIKKGMRCPPVF